MRSSQETTVPIHFDTIRIRVGGSTIARRTDPQTMLFLLKALGLPGSIVSNEAICIESAALFHDLKGRCYIRFKEQEDGQRLFSRISLVIDPAAYPGIKDEPPRVQRLRIRDFVAATLQARLRVMSMPVEGGDGTGASFREKNASEFVSPFIRVRVDVDVYHTVVTIAYLPKPAPDDGMPQATLGAVMRQVDALEERVAAVERENRELRKVNDMLLKLFAGLREAHGAMPAVPSDDILAELQAQVNEAASRREEQRRRAPEAGPYARKLMAYERS